MYSIRCEYYLAEFGGSKVCLGYFPSSQGLLEADVQHVPGPHEAVQLGELGEGDGAVGLDGGHLLLGPGPHGLGAECGVQHLAEGVPALSAEHAGQETVLVAQHLEQGDI